MLMTALSTPPADNEICITTTPAYHRLTQKSLEYVYNMLPKMAEILIFTKLSEQNDPDGIVWREQVDAESAAALAAARKEREAEERARLHAWLEEKKAEREAEKAFDMAERKTRAFFRWAIRPHYRRPGGQRAGQDAK